MNAEVQIKTVKLGSNGWPQRTFFYRPGDLEPCYVFNKGGPSKSWKGHDVNFLSLVQAKEWVEKQEFVKRYAVGVR